MLVFIASITALSRSFDIPVSLISLINTKSVNISTKTANIVSYTRNKTLCHNYEFAVLKISQKVRKSGVRSEKNMRGDKFQSFRYIS